MTTGINIALNRKDLIELPHSSPEITVTYPIRNPCFHAAGQEFCQIEEEKTSSIFTTSISKGGLVAVLVAVSTSA